jgi:hypothetical protein
MLFGIWRALKRLRLISGKAKLLFTTRRANLVVKARGSEGTSVAGNLADGTHQGMVIP